MKRNGRLAAYLRTVRWEKDLSLRDIERLSKKQISNAYFSQLERGIHETPSPTKLYEIAKVLEINYLELMVIAGYLTQKDVRVKA